MNRALAILGLTAVWTVLFATWDWRTILVGAIIATLLTVLGRRLEHPRLSSRPEIHATLKPLGTVWLIIAFIRELFLSAFQVAGQAWRPRLELTPGIITVPLEVESDAEIATLASLISLTPGTLSVEVSPDRTLLYVHALSIDGDGSETSEQILARLERPVQRAFRVHRA